MEKQYWRYSRNSKRKCILDRGAVMIELTDSEHSRSCCSLNKRLPLRGQRSFPIRIRCSTTRVHVYIPTLHNTSSTTCQSQFLYQIFRHSHTIQRYLSCGQLSGCCPGEVFMLRSSEVLTTLAPHFGQLSSEICTPNIGGLPDPSSLTALIRRFLHTMNGQGAR